MKIFIDSSAYIAYYNKRDENHEKAKNFLDKIKSKEISPIIFYTSDYIFDEVLTTIIALTGRKDLAIKVGNAIFSSKITKIIKVDSKIFNEAWELFKKYKDKTWSFTDCTSFIIMKINNIKRAFTFDEHYKQAEYVTVP